MQEMASNNLFHTIWGQIECSTSASHSGDGSSDHSEKSKIKKELQEVHMIQFQEWSSSSASSRPGKKELAAQGGDHVPAGSGAASSTEPLGREAALLDSLSMWSQGSMLHQSGDCRPCHYAHTSAGCIKGRGCTFCHLPHTGSSQHRPCKTRRKQCHMLAMLLETQQPEELRRLAAHDTSEEAVQEGTLAPQGLALCVQQVALKSPYMRSFLKKHWSKRVPAETMEPNDMEAISSTQADINPRATGSKSLVQL